MIRCWCRPNNTFVRPSVQTWLWSINDEHERHYWRHVYLSMLEAFYGPPR